jgi:hypothetical protein
MKLGWYDTYDNLFRSCMIVVDTGMYIDENININHYIAILYSV